MKAKIYRRLSSLRLDGSSKLRKEKDTFACASLSFINFRVSKALRRLDSLRYTGGRNWLSGIAMLRDKSGARRRIEAIAWRR